MARRSHSATSLPAGKVPSWLLDRLLEGTRKTDPRVIMGPGIGLDAAAITFGDNVLVIKSDPITFPTPDAAWYLVNVNANDVACLGAIPRWLLVTALLPEGSTTVESVELQFQNLTRACDELNIELIGGHSEITIGIDRPILCGTLLGETTRDGLLDLREAVAGDHIVLCNGIAIEGTAILASEAAPDLRSAVSESTIELASALGENPGISVVRTARALLDGGIQVRGLHDPTEGGLATALDEVAHATGCGLVVNESALDVLPETRQICDALGLDPLGLIASGALLAVLPASEVSVALETLQASGFRAADIGTLTDSADERTLRAEGQDRPLPTFATDELARYFAGVEPEDDDC